MRTLFTGSHLHVVLEQRYKTAETAVRGMSLTDLKNPALAGRLEKLWAAQRLNVPVLNISGRSGAKRKVQVPKSGYGHKYIEEQTHVDVSVPFRGDRGVFNFRPSSSRVLDHEVQISGQTLAYACRSKPQAQHDQLLQLITETLETIRSEEERFNGQAVKRIEDFAAALVKSLEEDNQKASKLDFPIR